MPLIAPTLDGNTGRKNGFLAGRRKDNMTAVAPKSAECCFLNGWFRFPSA